MIRRASLNNSWRFQWTEYLGENATYEECLEALRPDRFMSAQVPGDAHLDLMQHGVLPDLYSGCNIDHARWMETKDWVYTRRFSTPRDLDGRHVSLVFHGPDTYATIWLNGVLLGSTDNMYLKYEFDVTRRLRRSGRNELLIRIASPMYSVEMDGTIRPLVHAPERLFIRKAQMSFGWDIAPRLLTVGIWKDVELVIADRCRLGDVWVETGEIRDNGCDIALHIELEWLVRRKGTCVISGRVGDQDFRFSAVLSEGKTVIKRKLSVEGAGLWHPRSYGRQTLHDVIVRVGDRKGLLGRQAFRTGYRRVELIQDERPRGGRAFEFRCNGDPIFVTGLNWTPLDAIFARVTPQKVTDRLEDLAEIGCNMLRIWGGGIYESTHFFNEYDRLGILVWQDFMMAGGWFPQGREFARGMAREAEQVVRGIRNHPCIALYAGDNEIYQMIYRETPEYRDLINNNAITEKTLRRVCGKHDPHVPYVPSSPHSPTGIDHNADRQGDAHRYVHGQSYKAPTMWIPAMERVGLLARDVRCCHGL